MELISSIVTKLTPSKTTGNANKNGIFQENPKTLAFSTCCKELLKEPFSKQQLLHSSFTAFSAFFMCCRVLHAVFCLSSLILLLESYLRYISCVKNAVAKIEHQHFHLLGQLGQLELHLILVNQQSVVLGFIS